MSLFISIEAMDGAGKSSQARALLSSLKGMGHEVILTREPGGSAGAETIRTLLVSGDPDRWSETTEILLFTAARRDHVEKTIIPALNAGTIVISDRFADSTRAYQSVKNPDSVAMINALHAMTIGIEPDLTLILDMDPGAAWERSRARNGAATVDEDRFEKRGREFQQKVRQGFLDISGAYPERCRVVDASGTPDQVFSRILPIVEQALSAAGVTLRKKESPNDLNEPG